MMIQITPVHMPLCTEEFSSKFRGNPFSIKRREDLYFIESLLSGNCTSVTLWLFVF